MRIKGKVWGTIPCFLMLILVCGLVPVLAQASDRGGKDENRLSESVRDPSGYNQEAAVGKTGRRFPSALPASGRADSGKKALNVLISAIKNPDPDIRAAAAEAFGEVGNPSAVKLLKEKLKDRDPFVKISAAKSLFRMGDKTGLKTLAAIAACPACRVPPVQLAASDVPAQKKTANTALEEMKQIARDKIRGKAVEAMAGAGAEAEKKLLELRNDRSGAVRDAAAIGLARLGYEDDAAGFAEALESPDEAVRLAGASAISSICDPAHAGFIRRALATETSAGVKVALLEAAACMGANELLPEIRKGAEDKSNLVRLRAVSALSAIGGGAALAAIKSIYSSNEDIYIRVAARRGIVEAGEAADMDILKQALGMSYPEIKKQVMTVLERIPGDEAATMLSDCLEDPAHSVRVRAAVSILMRLNPAGGFRLSNQSRAEPPKTDSGKVPASGVSPENIAGAEMKDAEK
ncbi:MAG: HEAT repeat domain-containing protein [bacterium]